MSLLPLLTNRAPDAALYAPAGSGGGGGSVGPNLTLSTLALAGSADLAPSLFTTGASSQININANGGVIFGDMPPNLGASVNIYGGQGQIWCIDSADNVALQILPDGTGKCVLTQGTGGTGIALSNISSINGSAPGGGGATVSTFSDLTVSNPIASGATLNLRADDTDLYDINCVSSGVALAGLSIGLVGGRNQVYMDVAEVPALYTSTITGTTGVISLNPNGTDQIVIGGNGAPGDIRIATVGGGTINLQGPVNQTSGLMNVPGSASISSLTVSSINGAAYPPAPTIPQAVGQNWVPYDTTIPSGTLPGIQNYSTATLTPVYSTTYMFQMSGNLTSEVSFSGSGNTNPVTNVAQTSNANFGIALSIDGGPFFPLAQDFFTSANNSPPGGPFQTSNMPFALSTANGAFMVNNSYNITTPGVEFTYTALGAHTYQLKAWTDIYLTSGDSGANYSMALKFPKVADGGGSSAGINILAL